MSALIHKITSSDDRFEYGSTYEVSDDGNETFVTNWSRMKNDLWFIGNPSDILGRLGVTCTDAKRANDLSNMFDGDLSGYYYVAGASPQGSEEAIKWILGGLAAHLNEKGIPFTKINTILPADHLRAFCACLESGRLGRSFAKEAFADLLKANRFIDNDGGETVRLSGETVMDKIVTDPRFKAVDSSIIDRIIEEVIAANPQQAEKAKTDPRVIQFFVGNVMKASKGKSDPKIVQEKLKERFR